MKYSRGFRETILRKVLPPESQPIRKISNENGISEQTIRNWMILAKDGKMHDTDCDMSPNHRSPEEKLRLVSDDNPFIESYFKTMKYTVGYPKCFENLDHARTWMADFTDWYNTGHMHSKIGYVTPMQRHEGSDRPIFERRNAALTDAYRAHPERWSRYVRTWGAPSTVALNAARHPRKNAA